MENCLFCKIIAGEIPSSRVYEDDDMVGFKDINPVAPVHVLFVPKKHIATLDASAEEDFTLYARMLKGMRDYARKEGFADEGYRIVNNCNAYGGQDVYHLHFHLVAGRQMQWPPG